MKPDGWVTHHTGGEYKSLASLVERVEASGSDSAALFLGKVVWNDQKTTSPGWVVLHNGIFVNPFEAEYFFPQDCNLEASAGRLLNPHEVLHIRWVGEQLNGHNPPENVPVRYLIDQLRQENKEMGAILIKTVVWKTGAQDELTERDPNGEWVIWHGGVFVKPFQSEFFLAHDLDDMNTLGRLLRPGEPLEVSHPGLPI